MSLLLTRKPKGGADTLAKLKSASAAKATAEADLIAAEQALAQTAARKADAESRARAAREEIGRKASRHVLAQESIPDMPAEREVIEDAERERDACIAAVPILEARITETRAKVEETDRARVSAALAHAGGIQAEGLAELQRIVGGVAEPLARLRAASAMRRELVGDDFEISSDAYAKISAGELVLLDGEAFAAAILDALPATLAAARDDAAVKLAERAAALTETFLEQTR